MKNKQNERQSCKKQLILKILKTTDWLPGARLSVRLHWRSWCRSLSAADVRSLQCRPTSKRPETPPSHQTSLGDLNFSIFSAANRFQSCSSFAAALVVSLWPSSSFYQNLCPLLANVYFKPHVVLKDLSLFNTYYTLSTF